VFIDPTIGLCVDPDLPVLGGKDHQVVPVIALPRLLHSAAPAVLDLGTVLVAAEDSTDTSDQVSQSLVVSGLDRDGVGGTDVDVLALLGHHIQLLALDESLDGAVLAACGHRAARGVVQLRDLVQAALHSRREVTHGASFL